MKTIELLKDWTHKTNVWKKGDKPTVSLKLAEELVKNKVAKYAGQQAPAEQFRADAPTETNNEE